MRDSIVLPEEVPPDEAFERLAPIFATAGTSCEVDGDTLVYSKENPAAQDKLATFTSGTLRLERTGGTVRLAYDVGSTALLLCFLAPLLFLAFAQFAVLANILHGPEIEDARSEGAAADESEEPAELHWIDEMLGAPAPEAKDEKDKEEEEEDDEGRHSPTPGYVLAGIFAAVYLVGRILEPWLVKKTLRRALEGKPEKADEIDSQYLAEADARDAGPGETMRRGEDLSKPRG